ncbi:MULTISPECIES: hypothetical protein [Pseudomonas]|uniref:hypothetical protein n=1 Tax=Pseudomonas TaxID=286 RepID=UPI00099DCDCB|nr:hypothetical protein [Pseudomonas synxantha]MCK3838854.1 hypothetical protein [Pseudomonas sp. NCIMB 10586]OPA97805.1 hypothetical protein BFW89_27515 [Pseudomonas synxantha]
MTSLVEMRRLLDFSDLRQHQHDRQLDQACRSLTPLERELEEIEKHRCSLNDLLRSYRLQAQSLSHAELLALLRRQAVIRRQISTLALDEARVVEQYRKATLHVEQLQQRRKLLQSRHQKYQSLEQRLLAEHRSRQWRQEENDIEELLVSSK